MRVGVPRTRRSKAVAGAFLVLAMAAGAGGWLLRPEAEAVAASTTQAVATSTLKETVTATGTLRAARSEAMSFAVGGTVRAVLVREGDQVKKGAALARVDTTSLVAARTAARSSYDAALAQLDEDVDDGASDVQVAADRSSVVVARSSWVEARDAVDDAVLRAPMAGTVVGLDLAVGDTVGAGTTAGDTSGGSAAGAGTGSTATTTTSGSVAEVSIATTRWFAVDAEVAAADIEGVEPGLQVELTVSGVDETVYGTVATVGAVAETSTSGSAVFPVVVEVTGKRQDLYAGSSADLSIIVSQRTDVVTVPTQAVQTEDGQAYVSVEVDGTEERRDIEIGEASGAVTEVVSGLEIGESVVVPGFTGRGAGTGSQDGQNGRQGLLGGTPPSGSPGGGQVPGAPQ